MTRLGLWQIQASTNTMVWLSPLHRRRSQCIICRPLCFSPPPRRCCSWVPFPSVQGRFFAVVIFRTILSFFLGVGGAIYNRFWSKPLKYIRPVELCYPSHPLCLPLFDNCAEWVYRDTTKWVIERHQTWQGRYAFQEWCIRRVKTFDEVFTERWKCWPGQNYEFFKEWKME